MTVRGGIVAIALLCAVGCDKLNELKKDRGRPAAEAGCASDKDCKGDRVCDAGKCVDAKAKPATAPAAATGADATTAAAATPAATVPHAAPIPAGGFARHSDVPTVDEWNAMNKEVTVRGSSARGCQTKMVREWLRISCQDADQDGRKPTGVNLNLGGDRSDVFTFKAPGIASLVLPWVEGIHVEARFTWGAVEGHKHRQTRILPGGAFHMYVAYWPSGAPEPPSKGEFR